MNGKKKPQNLVNTCKTELKSWLKTELRTVYLTSDRTEYLSFNKAIIHEGALECKRIKDRRWTEMKTKIAELVCTILKEKKWGIFFKNEPMQALPVQGETASLYKINQVKDDDLVSAIEQALDERANEWEMNQGQNQTLTGLSNGMKKISTDTEE